MINEAFKCCILPLFLFFCVRALGLRPKICVFGRHRFTAAFCIKAAMTRPSAAKTTPIGTMRNHFSRLPPRHQSYRSSSPNSHSLTTRRPIQRSGQPRRKTLFPFLVVLHFNSTLQRPQQSPRRLPFYRLIPYARLPR